MPKSVAIMVVSSVLGGLGWWLGDLINLGAALILSTFASTYGIYLGWRLHADYLE